MIDFIMQLAVSVSSLTVCGSVNGVGNFRPKRQCSKSFMCESNIRVSAVGITFFF